MAQIVSFEGADGAVLKVEVDPSHAGEIGLVAGGGGGVPRAAVRLEDALESVRGAATALLATIERMAGDARRPDEVTLEFSISLQVEGGVIVAKGSAKAQAAVTLTWRAVG